jgi:CO/xanthine dehydrogenase Mo-binding subunit
MEGGALQGLSRALYEEVTWDHEKITSITWSTPGSAYPVFHFGPRFPGDTRPLPRVETVLLNRLDKPQMGAGECSITLVAGAIANAIFDATGARVRDTPFTAARVLAALQQRG